MSNLPAPNVKRSSPMHSTRWNRLSHAPSSLGRKRLADATTYARQLRTTVAMLCLTASACAKDATPAAQVVLSPIRLVELPDSIKPSGASFSAEGAPIAWTDDGKILESRANALVVSKALKLNGWTIKSVKMAQGGQTSALAARGDQTAIIRPGTFVPELIRSTDRLLAATPTRDGWRVIARDSSRSIFVATISDAGELQGPVRVGGMNLADPSQQWPAIATTPGHTLAAYGRDTLTLYCIGDGGASETKAVSMSELLSQAGVRGQLTGWALGTVVALDDLYLITLVDLRSLQRAIALVNRACDVVRVRQSADRVVPLMANSSSMQLLASNYSGRRQFVLMQWRRGARE